MRHLVPALPPGNVMRRRLLDQLAGWRSLRLIQVVAPAGFGKTSLGAEWIGRLALLPADERPACLWLSLQPGDGAPEVFLRHLLEALLPLMPELAATLTLAAAGEKSNEQCVRDIALRLQHLARPPMIAIDDCHLLDAPAVALIQTLLDLAPPLHLILLSRTPPQLDATQLVVRSACLTIDAQQMRFDHAEFQAFARSNALTQLSSLGQARLEARADGWFAGLLLLLHAHHHDDLLDRFIGAEILRPLPPDVLDFLTDVCPLPYLDAALCAAATGRPAAACAQLLRTSSRINALVAPLRAPDPPDAPSSDDVFRMHPLLQESLLHRRSERSTFTDELELRRRAAFWLAPRGRTDDALSFLLPPQQQERIDIINAAVRPALLRREIAAVRRWLTYLPPATLSTHPQLTVDAAWLEYFISSAKIRPAIEHARAALAHADSNGNDELRAELQVLDAIQTWIEMKPDHARALADEAQRMPHAPHGIAAGYLRVFDAYVPRDPNDFQARIRTLQDAANIFERAGYPHGAAEAASTQGFLKWRAANGAGAVASLTYALSLMQVTGWANSQAAAEAAFACGEILYHMDRHTDARPMFQHTLDLWLMHEHTSHIAYWAEIGLQLCDSLDTLRFTEDPSDGKKWVRILTSQVMILIGMAGAMRILRDHRRGKPEYCRQTLESIAIQPHELTPEMPDVLWYAVLSGCICSGRADADVERLLRSFHARMTQVQNPWMTLRTDVLLAVLLQMNDRADEALDQLEKTLPALEHSAMPRLVLDHPDLLSLLERSRQPYAQKLLAAVDGATAARRKLGLTPTERRILRRLTEDRLPQEIAAELFITIGTVREHLKNCYRKLGVHNRTEAIRVAREMGLF